MTIHFFRIHLYLCNDEAGKRLKIASSDCLLDLSDLREEDDDKLKELGLALHQLQDVSAHAGTIWHGHWWSAVLGDILPFAKKRYHSMSRDWVHKNKGSQRRFQSAVEATEKALDDYFGANQNESNDSDNDRSEETH